MSKRPAFESIEEVMESSEARGGTGAMNGESSLGGAAVPTKTKTADGTIDFTGKYNLESKDIITISYTGTTWLNNVDPQTGGPDSNLWAPFAWEYSSMWLTDQRNTSILSQYNSIKPIRTVVKFGDAQNYTQINTGATPIMIPNGHQKVYGILDTEYHLPISTHPFDWGTDNSLLPSSEITDAKGTDLLNSFRGDGYSVTTGQDSQRFLSNQFDFNNNITLGRQHPTCKSIRMGSGHEMTFEWNYNNKYWRDTKQYGIQSVLIMSAPQANWVGARDDELVGYIVRPLSFTGIRAVYFNSSGSNTGVSIEPVPTNDGGTLWQSEHLPQPKLLLHLAPDIGVLGTTGTSQCQINFQVTKIYEATGKNTMYGQTRGLTFSSTGAGTWNPNICTPRNINVPKFYPMSFI